MKNAALTFLLLIAPAASNAADIISATSQQITQSPQPAEHKRLLRGYANAVDGRSLWFPQVGTKVRLADLDACELPQWALDPKWADRTIKAPNPVPCGPIAKAWLKRTIANKPLTCNVTGFALDGALIAQCNVGNTDLALEMIRVGWGRVSTPYPANPIYMTYQTWSMANRYGMWATYVLDMDEWRRKAVDRSLSRTPYADLTLMNERQSEISPPFADARRKPTRTDR